MKVGNSFLEDLARNVTVLTGPQTLRAHFENDPERMRRTLRAHAAAGLITISTELVRSRILAGPIAVIEPGAQPPSAEHIAYLASKQWSPLLHPILTIRGTMKLAALYGGAVKALVSGHVSHEVALSDIFLFGKRFHDPGFQWSLIFGAPGSGAMPDAISGETAIELIGRYNGATVRAKLALSARYRLELW